MSFGARVEEGGVGFRVWAPGARAVDVVFERGGRRFALARGADGIHHGVDPAARPGDRYRYSADGAPPLPDPASRFQPEGVHGPSEIVDPAAFRWSDGAWRGATLEGLVLYELHVGAFTPEGTFAAAAARLPALRDLGVTAIELLPVADFPGARNWGYDGAALWAPSRAYGRPDDLRRLVDEAHRLGLGVLLDVVYNHFGPDGAYAAAFSPGFLSRRHRSPWGAGINLDGEGAAAVREFLIGNALHWVGEYHVDGFRFDATHAMVDASPRHFHAELAARLREARGGGRLLLTAEDLRNERRVVSEEAEGGWGFDATWTDDFHHELRRILTGDDEGWCADFRGDTRDLAGILERGWHYAGQRSALTGAPRGTDPRGLDPRRLVIYVQNHDQVGNRPHGERLHHVVGPAAFRAAVALLLAAPHTPLLFMGQEWAARAPFRFFTDHHPELGRRVAAGRRAEFRRYRAFATAQAREAIADPQDPATFAACRLDWEEREHPAHAAMLRFHAAMIALRREDPALHDPTRGPCRAMALDTGTVALRRGSGRLVVARLAGAGAVEIPAGPGGEVAEWNVLLSTEDPAFAPDPHPIAVRGATLEFRRPGAVVLGTAPAG